MARVRLLLKVTFKTKFRSNYYPFNTVHLYNLVNRNGVEYVVITESELGVWETGLVENEETGKLERDDIWHGLVKDDLVKLVATIKGEREYKGKKQLQINRCKIVEYYGMLYEARPFTISVEIYPELEGDDFKATVLYRDFKIYYQNLEHMNFRREPEAVIDVIVRGGETGKMLFYKMENGTTLRAKRKANAEKRGKCKALEVSIDGFHYTSLCRG